MPLMGVVTLGILDSFLDSVRRNGAHPFLNSEPRIVSAGHPATVPGQTIHTPSPVVVGLMGCGIHSAVVSPSGSVADNALGLGTERRSKGRLHTACACISVVVGDARRIL